jgi:hypothetical protein
MNFFELVFNLKFQLFIKFCEFKIGWHVYVGFYPLWDHIQKSVQGNLISPYIIIIMKSWKIVDKRSH